MTEQLPSNGPYEVPPDLGCKAPPDGWWCSRTPGHEGPCAARPTTPESAPSTLPLAEIAQHLPPEMVDAFWDAAAEAHLVRLERAAGITTPATDRFEAGDLK